MAYQPKSYRKFVATAATATLVASAIAPAVGAASNFTDVAPKYKDAVDYLVANNITQGTSDTLFGTHDNIKRGDLAIWLAKALKLDTTGAAASGFVDTKGTRYDAYVSVLKAKGFISGKSATEFAPNATVTRGEMAIMLSNAYDLKSDTATKFTDAVGNYKTAIQGLYAYGVTTGKSDTMFGTSMNITRGDLAIFLKRAAEVVKTPAVVSVSAINAKQIEVKFNKAVTAATAEDEVNYTVRKSGDASFVALAGVTADLAADGKSVVLTADGSADIETALGVAPGAVFELAVKNIKDAAGTKLASFTQTLKVNDEVAPTFVSASASAKTSTNQVTLTFSEPVVVTSGVVKVNGAFGSVAQGSTPNTLTVTTGANLDAGKTYDVEVLNFTDYAGNFLTANPAKTTVTVSANVNAPVVSAVNVVRDNLIEVTFDKAMAPGTLTNSTIKLLDGNFADLAAGNITGVSAKAGSGNKTFQISLDNVPALPFNNGVFNATLVFTNSITDSVGNTLSTTNRAVSLTRDVTAPTVASVKHVKASSTVGANYGGVALANGVVVVQFNEAVTKGTLTGLKLIDNNGVDVTTTYIDAAQITAAQVNVDDATELVIPLKAVVPTTLTSFTLRLPAAAAADKSLNTNGSTAAVNSFVTVPGTGTTTDTLAPNATGVTVSGNTLQIAVTEANSLNASTVLDLNNYRLDGAPLPAGTYATVTGTAPSFTINLFLPTGSISQTRNYSLNVSGIKDAAGNTMSIKAFNAVALVDDVKPELKTATLNADGSVSLGYSEAVTGVTAADLEFTVNGKVVASTSLNVAAITTGAEAGKTSVTADLSYADTDGTASNGNEVLYIDVEGSATTGYEAGVDILVSTGTYTALNAGTFNFNNASTIKAGTVASPANGADGEGNTLKGSTTITVK